MDFHFANVWETVADAVPARTALISNGVSRS
jgi:hypothetical protein